MSKRKEEILKIYCKLAKSLGSYPKRSDMLNHGVPRDAIRSIFGNLEALRDEARKINPAAFDKIVDPEFFNNEVFDALRKEVKQHKRFVITTAVAGAPIHEDFLASIKTYCKLRNAMLLIIPANYALYDLDPELVQNEHIVFRGLRLNSNISISPVKIDPKQVDPTVGLDGVGQREGTVLLGSPKQRMRPAANSNKKLPHILQATGAITKPKYVPKDGIPKRRDFLAERQHVVGAIVVEIEDDTFYHFRQIQAARDGSFNDLFVNYSEDRTLPSKTAAIVQGDYHIGETDPSADACADELCRIGKPKYRVFHDLFDGKSINHHEKKNKILRAQHANEGKLSLATELHALKLVLQEKLKLKTAENLLVTASNHNEFLIRYLQEGDFEDHNRLIATKLQVMAIEGKDPLKAGLEELFGFKDEGKVIWCDRDQDFKISKEKIEIGAHGDLGSNGKRNPGSAGLGKAYGNVMFGHCHYGQIDHGSWSVGTTSYLQQNYNRGPSSWTHTHGVIYEDGTRQLINSIYGKWRLKD